MIHTLELDVDGKLTDGKIYMGESGGLLKAFNIKEGCEELVITKLYQGVSEKLPMFEKLFLDANYDEISYCMIL